MDEAKISILYAEDDEFGAKLTKTILEKENFEVEIVSDGSEAWKAYKERKPDILLLDLDMPGKDGLEITRLVREHDQQTPHPRIHHSRRTCKRSSRTGCRSRRIYQQRKASRSFDSIYETSPGKNKKIHEYSPFVPTLRPYHL